jgi:hypothetical protein
MEVTTPTNSSAPPSATKSSDDEVGELSDHSKTPMKNEQPGGASGIIAPAAAAAAVHQPKIVQTAFIHKLYKCVFLLRLAPADRQAEDGLLTPRQYARGR